MVAHVAGMQRRKGETHSEGLEPAILGSEVHVTGPDAFLMLKKPLVFQGFFPWRIL
jgi:hypothetical protein